MFKKMHVVDTGGTIKINTKKKLSKYRGESLIYVTYQHFLELFYCLIGNADAINLPDLISYMQSPWGREIMN